MSASIKSKVVRIGNLRGLRIPKNLLDALHLDLEHEVSLKVEDDQLIINKKDSPFPGYFTRGNESLLEDGNRSPVKNY